MNKKALIKTTLVFVALIIYCSLMWIAIVKNNDTLGYILVAPIAILALIVFAYVLYEFFNE